jgi:hypothetical protein
MTKVLLIHSGNEFPPHINDCISQLIKFNFEIHLVLSESLHSFVEQPENIILSSIEENTDYRYESFTVNHDISFRDSFWLRVSNRFFIIDNYAKKNNIENFIYIENDVLLYNNFEKNIEILKKTNCEICVSVDSERRAVPCLIYFRDSEATSNLSNHYYNNRNWNDMENLFIYFNNNRDKVINFPILPNNSGLELCSQPGIRDTGNINYSFMFEEFSCIFDPQAIGQYIGGLDQRIHHRDTIGFVNETTIFDVSKLDFIWIDSLPYINFNDRKIPIHNIHVHSKDLQKLMNM